MHNYRQYDATVHCEAIASFHHGNGSCVPLAAVADVSNSLLAVMFYANSLLLGRDTAMTGESHPTCGGDGPSVGRRLAAASDVSTTTGNESADMGDSYVISMPAGFRRHLVGKTLMFFTAVIALKYALLAR